MPAFCRLVQALDKHLDEAAQVEESKQRHPHGHPVGAFSAEDECNQEGSFMDDGSHMGVTRNSNKQSPPSQASAPSKSDHGRLVNKLQSPDNNFRGGLLWTPDEDHVLLNLSRAGLSPQAITEHLPGRSPASASYRLVKLGSRMKRGTKVLDRGGPHITHHQHPRKRTNTALAPQKSSRHWRSSSSSNRSNGTNHRQGSRRDHGCHSRGHSRPEVRRRPTHGPGPRSLPRREGSNARRIRARARGLMAVADELNEINQMVSMPNTSNPRHYPPPERVGQSLTINLNGTQSAPDCMTATGMGGRHRSRPSGDSGVRSRQERLSRKIRDIRLGLLGGDSHLQ